jgi:NAD(P)H-hydrate epimerase
LKGYKTVIANPNGEAYINETGNSGMSTAGSGDVLTGIIASFVGQGIDCYSASVLGVYLHGRAGDLAAKEKGQFSLIASDLLTQLPNAIKEIV